MVSRVLCRDKAAWDVTARDGRLVHQFSMGPTCKMELTKQGLELKLRRLRPTAGVTQHVPLLKLLSLKQVIALPMITIRDLAGFEGHLPTQPERLIMNMRSIKGDVTNS